jgi:Concanavalin A-like lectin/glucanases superfamily
MKLMHPYDLLGPGGPGWGHLGTPVNPYRFLITPLPNGNTDLYYDLSLAPAGFWAHVRPDGGDIRIVAQDGVTPLPREVSGFDPVGQLGSLFIGSAGNTSFYVTYGNPANVEPAPGSPYGKYAVWESAATGIWHMEDLTTPLLDSTANGNDAIATGPVTPNVSGKIQQGTEFDHGQAVPASAVFSGDAYSIAMWVQFHDFTQATQYIFSRGRDSGSGFDAIGRYETHWIIFNDTTVLFGTFPNAGQWYHVVFTRNGTSVALYVDGLINIPISPLAVTYLAGKVFIGGRSDGPALGITQGLIDESRTYNRTLSPTEIATMHANQDSPGTFWTTGPET